MFAWLQCLKGVFPNPPGLATPGLTLECAGVGWEHIPGEEALLPSWLASGDATLLQCPCSACPEASQGF